jgi:hypothetical protein
MQFNLKETPIANELSKQSLDICFVFSFENMLIENWTRRKRRRKSAPIAKMYSFREDL